MEYIPLNSFPFYGECAPLIADLGFNLVELRVIPAKTLDTVRIVIAKKDASSAEGISVNDCAKVHRAIQPRIEALITTKDVNMEVTSPGMERNIKNAAEFALFVGCYVRLWNTDVSDWVPGKIVEANDCTIQIQKEDGEKLILSFGKIAKAKLLSA